MTVGMRLAMLRADASALRSRFERAGRVDLASTTRAVLESLSTAERPVLIVGEYKSGKSSVLRSLLDGALALPGRDDRSSTVPLWVRSGSSTSAKVTSIGQDGSRPVDVIHVADALELLAQEIPSIGERRVVAVEIDLSHELLEQGIVLVDTPSSYGPRSAQTSESLELAQTAACAVVTSDASQPLTDSVLTLIENLCRVCDRVILALTKIDLYADWRYVDDLNGSSLRARELQCAVVPISSELARHAARTEDPSLLDESGIPQLREAVVRSVFDDLLLTATSTLLALSEEYVASLEREHEELADPERAALRLQELVEERDRLIGLKDAAPLWQQRLGDGYERLVHDTDHLCLTRTRALVQEVSDLIDSGDPVASWPEWQAWLLERVQSDQALVVEQIRQRADELDRDLNGFFRAKLAHDVSAPELEVHAAAAEFAPPSVRFEVISTRRHMLNAVKATSASITMFSVLGVMAGVSLGPLVVAPAGLLARNALRDEMKRGLERNRALAKGQASRFCEDVRLATGRVVRAQCQYVRIALRDHYQTVAADLLRTVTTQIAEVNKSMQRSKDEQRQRRVELEHELDDARSMLAALASRQDTGR